MESTRSSKFTAMEIVMASLQALNERNYDEAQKYISDEISFEGVLSSHRGSDSYLNEMETLRLTYDIKKSFQEGDDVCLLYDLNISGQTIFGCGWYHLKNGKIDAVRIVFDPRPLLGEHTFDAESSRRTK